MSSGMSSGASGSSSGSSGSSTSSGSTSSSSSGGIISATNSALSVAPIGDVEANGADAFTITVFARDAAGNGLPGIAVTTTATGSGVAYVADSATTDATGTHVTRISSTVAETKTVTVVLDPTGEAVTLGMQPLLSFVPGAAAALSFTQGPPASTTAGMALAPVVRVALVDANGNRVMPTTEVDVTLALTGGTPGAMLTGTATQTTSGGEATFNGLSLQTAGSGYALVATSGALTQATSSMFDVAAGPPSVLAFATPPGMAVNVGQAMPAVRVAVQDSFNNTVTSATTNISIAKGVGSPAGTLSGTLLRAASMGVASFDDLAVDTQGTGFTLTASANGLTPISSAPFNVVPAGMATRWVLVGAPTSVAAGASFGFTVEAQDGGGSLDTSVTGTVTLTLVAGNGATLAPMTMPTATVTAGQATFSGLSIALAGTGYTLSVAGGSLTTGTAPLAVTAGPATALVFVNAPTAALTAGSPIDLRVEARDALGNVDTAFASQVTLTSTATLTNGAPVTAAMGVAVFPMLNIRTAGTGYTLTAAGGMLMVTSAPFDVVPAAAVTLEMTAMATTVTAGTPLALTLTVRDAFANIATAFTGSVTLTATGPTPPMPLVFSFAGADQGVHAQAFTINRSGTYTVIATPASTTISTASLPGVIVTAGVATNLQFATLPTDGLIAVALPTFTVEGRDTLGNRDLTFVGLVTLTVTTPSSGAPAISGNTATAVAGVATFANFQVAAFGTGLVVTASSGALTTAASMPFSAFNTNQPPVLTSPPTAMGSEDVPLAFTAGLALSIADPDAGTDPLEVALTVDAGTMTLGVTTGLTITVGPATASAAITVQGTLTNLNTALASLTYLSASNSSAPAMLSIVVNDLGRGGTAMPMSDSGVVAISLMAVNDAPVITGLTDTVTFLEDGLAVALDATPQNAVVTDVDSVDLNNGVLRALITTGLVGAEDVLSVKQDGQGSARVTVVGTDVRVDAVSVGTMATPAAGDLTVTFNSSSTPDTAQAVARALTYANSNTVNPNQTNRLVTVTLSDGDGGTSTGVVTTVQVQRVNDSPVITGLSGDVVTFAEDAVTGTALDATQNAAVTDEDTTDFATATLVAAITAGGTPAEDTLTLLDEGTGAGQVGFDGVNVSVAGVAVGTAAGGTGVTALTVTFSAGASAAQVSDVVQALAYLNTNTVNPSTAARTVTVTLGDGAGGSVMATVTVNVTASNDAPTLGGLDTDAPSGTQATAVLLDVGANATVTDADSPNLDAGTLTVTITVGGATGDVLAVGTSTGLIIGAGTITDVATQVATFTGGSDVAPLVVTFNTQSTPAIAQRVVRALTAQNTNGASARTITAVLTDGDGGTSATSTVTLTFN